MAAPVKLLLNTYDADSYTSGNNSYRYSLNGLNYMNASNLTLNSISFPLSFPNVTSKANILTFKFTAGTCNVTIPTGIYTSASFCTAFNTAATAAIAAVIALTGITMTMANVSNCFTITASATTILNKTTSTFPLGMLGLNYSPNTASTVITGLPVAAIDTVPAFVVQILNASSNFQGGQVVLGNNTSVSGFVVMPKNNQISTTGTTYTLDSTSICGDLTIQSSTLNNLQISFLNMRTGNPIFFYDSVTMLFEIN